MAAQVTRCSVMCRSSRVLAASLLDRRCVGIDGFCNPARGVESEFLIAGWSGGDASEW